MNQLLVDFNDSDADDLIVGLQKNLNDRQIEVDQELNLYDREGNSALGRIASVEIGTLSVIVDWDTWTESVI